jgi:hypothetical protein
MAANSGSDVDDREDAERHDPELANGDSVSERLEEIEFEQDTGNSVAEIRGKLDSDS